MSLECNYIGQHSKDIEEELEQFFIRKIFDSEVKGSSCTKVVQRDSDQPVCNELIPLLICDVHNNKNITFMQEKMVNHALGVPFRYCLLHGRVVGRSFDNKQFYKYTIDDNTGCIEIRIFRRHSDLEKIQPLEMEVESLKFVSAAQNKIEITECLRRLLKKVRHHMDFSNIPIGCKVLVYGKPSLFLNKVSIDVISVYRNNHLEDLEIEYKDFLIDWYWDKQKESKLY